MALKLATLPYRKPELGKHYWIKDNILPDAFPVVERCLNKTEWTMGAPWRSEPWPGMRAPDALLPEELAVVEDWVKSHIGVKALFFFQAEDGIRDVAVTGVQTCALPI